MTILTPRFLETNHQRGNGAGAIHVVSPHEPIPAEAKWTIPPSVLPIEEQTKNVAPVTEPSPLKIALIGTAPSSRMMAPFADPSWTIWACSPGNQGALPKVDAWFEIHGTNLLWPENKHYGEPYIAWLKQQKFPIYMHDNALVPNATPYPMKEMVDDFGPFFFTSSFAWMMALGIKMGAKEIALYGIDMASRDEYIIQRPGAYYFMIRAAERGCKIWAPHESDIMQPPGLYGYTDVKPFGRKILARKSEIHDRLTGMRQQRDSLIHNITYLEGASEDIDYFQSIHSGAQDNSDISYLDRLIDGSQPSTKTSPNQG